MLNQTKDILKKKIRANKLHAIRFKKYSEYKNYFISEDKKSNWDPSAFTKIIETHLVNKKKLILVEIGVARGATSLYTIKSLKNRIDSYFGIDPYKSNYDKTDIVSSYNQDLMDNCYLFFPSRNSSRGCYCWICSCINTSFNSCCIIINDI